MGGITSTTKDLTFSYISILCLTTNHSAHTLELSSVQILNSEVPSNSEGLSNYFELHPTIPPDLLFLLLHFLALPLFPPLSVSIFLPPPFHVPILCQSRPVLIDHNPQHLHPLFSVAMTLPAYTGDNHTTTLLPN